MNNDMDKKETLMTESPVNDNQTKKEEAPDVMAAAEKPSVWAWVKAWTKEILFKSIIPYAAVTVILFKFVFCLAFVDGYSMSPTYNNGDFLLANHITCHPDYGDAVIIKHTSRGNIIKRVIGLPGDVIEVDGANGVVYRNGTAIDEPYVTASSYTNGDLEGPITVEDGHVFVMGDNRQNSYDSRFDGMGQIPEEDIYSEVLFRIMRGENK